MKRKLALMLVVSLILSLGAFSTVSFAAEDEIIIATGEEFKEEVTASNFGRTFIIQDDIVLPEDYVSVVGFYGTLKGAGDGKKSIQIDKPLFASFNGNTTIENISLKTAEGDTLTTTVANYGALVCSISGNYNYVIDKVANYCALSSSKNYVGGLIGLIEGGTVTLSNCSNYANITSTGRYVAGIVGAAITEEGETLNLNVTKSFNAGNISGGRFTCGIIGIADKTNASNEVSHCFNVGNLTTSSTNAAGGVAGIVITNEKGKATVNYCYNAGRMTGNTVVIARVAAKGYFNGYSENCYYIGPCADNENTSVGKEKTIKQLASGLKRLGFDTDIWEYSKTDENNKYSLPQIKGNPFVTTDETWYVESVTNVVISDTTYFSPVDVEEVDPSYNEENEEYESYAVVLTKFELPRGVETFTYGMLLSEQEEFDEKTASAIAKGKKEVYGAFGILFYGNKFVGGNTYYVKPYVEIDGVYTLGNSMPFKFPVE